jgi:hypothetical protein
MKTEEQEHTGNQAGPSSAAPETQAGLQEHLQSGEQIIAGARNDDQLQALNGAAQKPALEKAPAAGDTEQDQQETGSPGPAGT